MVLLGCDALWGAGVTVVADTLTAKPLAGASVFDKHGKFIGTTRHNGGVYCASKEAYPITVRYMGFHEKIVTNPGVDTIFMRESPMKLPEVVVETRNQRMLHMLAYVREYSTLSTYTDTVTLFREKMVDFMLPCDAASDRKGWRTPRVLNSRSYYQFTDASGRDSVSNRCSHHFSWSDWVGIVPSMPLPSALAAQVNGTDTVRGKYSATEIWVKNGDRLSVDVNVLADTASRRWVPNLSLFFSEDMDFERFGLRMTFGDVVGEMCGPEDLTGYSFTIESRGRGRDMFQFHRHDEPFFVTTYTEVYMLDKEYITVKEAKKWEKHKFGGDEIEIYEPIDAPDLQPSIRMLVDRVNRIDVDKVRLAFTPDRRLMGRNVVKKNFSVGHRALFLLKQLTGISRYKSHRNSNRRWSDFRREQLEKNKQ